LLLCHAALHPQQKRPAGTQLGSAVPATGSARVNWTALNKNIDLNAGFSPASPYGCSAGKTDDIQELSIL